MALPSSGTLSINDIRGALSTSNGSLHYLSGLAGFSTPDAISDFYGYNPGIPRSLYWTNATYYFGYYLNLFISLNSNATVLVNDTVYDGIDSGTTGYTTGDSALFVNEGSSGGFYAYQVLQVYDGNLGYIVNQTAGTSDPYLYQTVFTDSSYGNWDVTSYIESL